MLKMTQLSESLEVVLHYITVSIIQLVSKWRLYVRLPQPFNLHPPQLHEKLLKHCPVLHSAH